MTTPHTPPAAPDVAAIEARAAAATPGPWATDYVQGERAIISGGGPRPLVVPWSHADALMHDDAAFIAHAREDVPALLAHITALRAQHAADVAAAVAGEREQCARLCEDRAAHLDAAQGEEEPDDANDEEMEGYGRFLEALHLADTIRERSAIAAPTGGGE